MFCCVNEHARDSRALERVRASRKAKGAVFVWKYEKEKKAASQHAKAESPSEIYSGNQYF